MYNDITELEQKLLKCSACDLRTAYNKGATSYNGTWKTPLMLVGEGPGQVEDDYGVPLVGPSGQLLDRALYSVGITRDCVYTTNVVKCRPRGNRTPTLEEGEICAGFWLSKEIELIRPAVIVALGSVALRYLKDGQAKITRERGIWFVNKWDIDTIATYHPAYLLRLTGKQLTGAKWDVYHDLQAVVSRVREKFPDYLLNSGSQPNLLDMASGRYQERNNG